MLVFFLFGSLFFKKDVLSIHRCETMCSAEVRVWKSTTPGNVRVLVGLGCWFATRLYAVFVIGWALVVVWFGSGRKKKHTYEYDTCKDNMQIIKWCLDVFTDLVFLLLGFFVMAGLISFSVSGLSLIGCSLSLFSFSILSPSGFTLSGRSPSGRPSVLARSPSPSGRSLSARSLLSLRSFLGGGGIGYCWATCWATSWELILGFLWRRSKAQTWISLVVELWADSGYAPT